LLVGTDNIVVVLLQNSGLQADATLNNYQFLSDLTAAGNLEATFTNYSRHILAGADITVSVNTGTGIVTVSLNANRVWNAAGGATNNTLGAFLTAYRPTSGSADSAVLLLTKHDFATSTTGGALTATVSTIATAT